jgi:type IV secretory pathway VirB3-like protein
LAVAVVATTRPTVRTAVPVAGLVISTVALVPIPVWVQRIKVEVVTIPVAVVVLVRLVTLTQSAMAVMVSLRQ